jgi:hypothetical protein
VTQLKNIFPDYAHRVDLYVNCCDFTGKLVRNKDFYAEYKKQGHKNGKRG